MTLRFITIGDLKQTEPIPLFKTISTTYQPSYTAARNAFLDFSSILSPDHMICLTRKMFKSEFGFEQNPYNYYNFIVYTDLSEKDPIYKTTQPTLTTSALKEQFIQLKPQLTENHKYWFTTTTLFGFGTNEPL